MELEASVIELKQHLKKLQSIISNGSGFKLFGVKILDKNKIDDTLCCIEVTIPKEYKKYLIQGVKASVKNIKLESVPLYHSIKNNIQRKYIFSSLKYAVKYDNALSAIQAYINLVEGDIRRVYENL